MAGAAELATLVAKLEVKVVALLAS